MHVITVGEEEGIDVSGLGPVQVLSNLGDMLAQVGENFLIIIGAHLGLRDVEEHIDGLLNRVTILASRHFRDCPGELINVNIIGVHLVQIGELALNLLVLASDCVRFLWPVLLNHGRLSGEAKLLIMIQSAGLIS